MVGKVMTNCLVALVTTFYLVGTVTILSVAKLMTTGWMAPMTTIPYTGGTVTTPLAIPLPRNPVMIKCLAALVTTNFLVVPALTALLVVMADSLVKLIP